MTEAITFVTPALLALVPVVIGLVSILKVSGVPSRFAPALSLLLGIAGSFLIGGVTIAATVLGGVVVGLMASGLYSGGAATFKSDGSSSISG